MAFLEIDQHKISGSDFWIWGRPSTPLEVGPQIKERRQVGQVFSSGLQ